jgi:hypothetical protein
MGGENDDGTSDAGADDRDRAKTIETPRYRAVDESISWKESRKRSSSAASRSGR